jgi:hypothetical protein
MTRAEALEAAAKLLARLAEHGTWYGSAIELDTYPPGNLDGEELFKEAQAIFDVIEATSAP